MTDPARIWADAKKRMHTWPRFEALLKAGLRVPHIFLDGDFRIGADQAAINNGRWEQRFQGDDAYIVPVYEPIDGELVDLVAFRLETPKSYWTLDGRAPFLGYDALYEAEARQQPLMVYESPLEWLKDDQRGIVILDWQHHWPLWLANVPALRCRGIPFGRRLHATLQRPLEIPDVQVAA
jgi:hypothetical protein